MLQSKAMNVTNLTAFKVHEIDYTEYIEVKSVFSKEECFSIRSSFDKELKTSLVGNDVELKTLRNSSHTFIHRNAETNWIFEKLAETIFYVNNNLYHFELNYFGEGAQFTKYEKGCYYNWHKDFGPNNFSNRKLSAILCLSSSDEYVGGQLEFFDNANPVIASIGNVIVFPSFELHRVTEVLSGTRYSLVTWVSGAPFR